jgi:hypothetical protein
MVKDCWLAALRSTDLDAHVERLVVPLLGSFQLLAQVAADGVHGGHPHPHGGGAQVAEEAAAAAWRAAHRLSSWLAPACWGVGCCWDGV